MSIKNYLPTKKFSFFFLLALTVFVLIFFKESIFLSSEERTFKKEISNTKASELALLDTDGDGLYDWEEFLWGTDPTKKDTNGDGIDDKTEVENKKIELGITSIQSSSSDANLTETDKIAREMFSLIVALNQKGFLNDGGIKTLTESYSENILNFEDIKDPSKDINIKTIPDSPANKALYKKTTLAILEQGKNNGVGKELGAMANIIEEKTEKTFELEKSASAYAKMAGELSGVDVPLEISDIHKNIIVESIRISLSIKLLALYENDPAISFRGVFLYKKYSDELEKNLYSLLSYFQ